VTDAVRYVYVPENWAREERARQNVPGILRSACMLVIITFGLAGAIIGAVHWSRKLAFSARAFFAVFAAVFVLGVINVINNAPALASQAITTQPLELQIGIMMVSTIVYGLFMAAGVGLVAGLAAGEVKLSSGAGGGRSVVIGICTGLAIGGIIALARLAVHTLSPSWGNLNPASAFVPFISAATSPLGSFFTQTMVLIAVLYGVKHKPSASIFWIITGMALVGTSMETISGWLVTGLAMGTLLLLAYRLVFRHQPELLLITTGTLAVLASIREGIQRMYPWALPGSFAGALLIATATWLWFRGSMKQSRS
jgi:hypothetical protein